jgi:hypothetical protein
LFKRGVTLVGTAAYQTYPCIIGAYLPTAAFNERHRPSVVEFRPSDNEEDIGCLACANPTFKPRWHPDDKLPKVFMADDGLRVIQTRVGRGRKSVLKLMNSAVPQQC